MPSWWPMKKTRAAGVAIVVSMVFVVFALVVMPEETLAGKSLAVARATLALVGCALGFAVFAALSGLGDRMRPREVEEKPPLSEEEWKKY